MAWGSLRAPVARSPAAKAPQVVEIPGRACFKRKKKTTVRGEKVPLVGDSACGERGGECRRVGGDRGETVEQTKVEKTQKPDLGRS
jgi:hypothetical protein